MVVIEMTLLEKEDLMVEKGKELVQLSFIYTLKPFALISKKTHNENE
jgi:predicted MPP superfamily phosphohydrolase